MICGQYVECTPDKGEKLYGVVVCFGSTYGSWAIVHMNDGTFRSFGIDRLRTLVTWNDAVKDLENVSGKLQQVIDAMDINGDLDYHCFTFPDGETWWATGHDPNG